MFNKVDDDTRFCEESKPINFIPKDLLSTSQFHIKQSREESTSHNRELQVLQLSPSTGEVWGGATPSTLKSRSDGQQVLGLNF